MVKFLLILVTIFIFISCSLGFHTVENQKSAVVITAENKWSRSGEWEIIQTSPVTFTTINTSIWSNDNDYQFDSAEAWLYSQGCIVIGRDRYHRDNRQILRMQSECKPVVK